MSENRPDSPRVAAKLLLFAGDKRVFGPGKADLLAAIDTHGSISAAARVAGLSYRRAWLLVDAMNQDFAEPLVATTVGGRGGATLTATGRAVIERYRALDAAVEATTAKTAGPLLGMVRREPD